MRDESILLTYVGEDGRRDGLLLDALLSLHHGGGGGEDGPRATVRLLGCVQ